MSARNKPEAKAERREERQAAMEERSFMAAVQFALQAGRATGNVPIEVLEDSLAYGESLVKPGISLDDALELEAGLRAMRALLTYRRSLEGLALVYTVDAVEYEEGEGVQLALTGAERAHMAPGTRVIITPMGPPPEKTS